MNTTTKSPGWVPVSQPGPAVAGRESCPDIAPGDVPPPPPAWHWLPTVDGKRHAVAGRQVRHDIGEAVRTLCGLDVGPSQWKYAPFRHPSCLGCWAVAKELQP